MNNFEGFGERLKMAIKDSNFSQKALSEKLRIDEDTIGNYIKEKSFPKLNCFSEICKLLKVSADWLLYGVSNCIQPEALKLNGEVGALSEIEKDIILKYRKINDLRDKDDIQDYIDMKYKRFLKNPAPPSSTSKTGESDTGEEAATSEIA